MRAGKRGVRYVMFLLKPPIFDVLVAIHFFEPDLENGDFDNFFNSIQGQPINNVNHYLNIKNTIHN